MDNWDEELCVLTDKDNQSEVDSQIATQEPPGNISGNKYIEGVVIPAFTEIEKTFKNFGAHAQIHWETNYAWLTIGHTKISCGEEEHTKELKYEVEISGSTVKSTLYKMMSFGPQKKYPIDYENEITGDAKGTNIADITSKDIIDDFTAAFEEYINNEPKSEAVLLAAATAAVIEW